MMRNGTSENRTEGQMGDGGAQWKSINHGTTVQLTVTII